MKSIFFFKLPASAISRFVAQLHWRINSFFNPSIVFFILCLILPSCLHAQTYYFDNYNVADGLAQSTVYSIIQDSRHVIWIGTQSGVSRFDGKTFENFTSTEHGLALNGVRAILEDSHKKIWLGHSGGGITLWTHSGFDKITNFKNTIKSDITSIIEDKKGHIWITTFGSGAFQVSNPEAETSSLKISQYKGDKLSDIVFNCNLTRNGSLYFITDVGIRKYNQADNSFETVKIEGLTTYFAKTCMLEDRDGNLWVGTYNGGLYKFMKKDNSMIVYDIRDGLSFNWISSLFEDSQGNIWAGTWGGGITRFNANGIRIFNTSNGLQDDKIRCITEDAEGNILIGTGDNGLSIFKGEHFISYTKKDGLKDPQVWTICQDKSGNFWFGTNSGISVYHPDRKNGKKYSYYTEDSHLINDQIRLIRKDLKGNMWIATYNGGIYMYNVSTGRFTYDNNLNLSDILPNDKLVTAMAIDQKNLVWIGTNDGLAYFDPSSRKGDRLGQLNGLSGNQITSVFCDSKGILWAGSRGKGISRQNGDQKKFTPVDTLRSATPKCFAEDSKGNIWIGTENEGLFIYNQKSVIKHFTEKDGLLANLINLLVIDRNDNVYIGTNKGLNRYASVTNKFYAYARKNGFTGIETRENSGYLDTWGNLWFGTVNGAIEYLPHLEKQKGIQPLTDIRSLRVNYEYREMLPGLNLRYYENNIIFDYTSICLTNPEAVAYQVMLKGADVNWQPVTQQTMVTYPSLDPKKYTFMVRARNSEGIWNTDPITFSFQIKPPFYKTWWFIMFSTISFIILIAVYIALRERNLVRDKKILEAKVRERTIEVTLKNQELAMKNKDITDSLNYAQRLQFALLTPYIPFQNTFIMFKPKAIVSGDFYWILTGDNREYIAAVDCTGHGVPGAFMSIIGHNSLNKIVKEYRILEPAIILEHLNMEITLSLHQQGKKAEINDGMDIALICYNRQNKMLSYAGAFNPLFLIRDGKLFEYRADRFPIGRQTPANKKFTNHEFEIHKEDVVYIFSDGYADQMGGPVGKKFKASRIKELLLSIHHLPMDEQKIRLEVQLEEWMGDLEQIDDVLFIGRKF